MDKRQTKNYCLNLAKFFFLLETWQIVCLFVRLFLKRVFGGLHALGTSTYIGTMVKTRMRLHLTMVW
jgi:hypothetical protein